MKKSIVVGLTVLLLSFVSSAWANSTNEQAKGLIQNWFESMKNGDTDKAANYLAPTFISVHTDGNVRDKTQEIKLIKNLHMSSYKLSNFKFAQTDDVVVVTYKDEGSESIDNSPIGTGATLRMVVLQKQGGKWFIIAYANLAKV